MGGVIVPYFRREKWRPREAGNVPNQAGYMAEPGCKSGQPGSTLFTRGKGPFGHAVQGSLTEVMEYCRENPAGPGSSGDCILCYHWCCYWHMCGQGVDTCVARAGWVDRVSWQSGRGDLELRAAGGPGRGEQIVTDEEIWELSLSFQPHCGEEAERTSGRGNTLCKRLELLWGDLRRLSACLVAQTVKVLPAVQDSWFQSLGLGRSPGEGNGYPLQYSCLETSVDRGAWRATVCGVTKS